MKTIINKLEINPDNKQTRILINNQKCEIALKKGYKYYKSGGKIIGQRNKEIKTKINGYTVISFVSNGIKQYLYGTTFIEYILKNKTEDITNEEIELAKMCVKPSEAFLVINKIKRNGKSQKKNFNALLVQILLEEEQNKSLLGGYETREEYAYAEMAKIILEDEKDMPLSKNINQTKTETLKRNSFREGYHFRAKTEKSFIKQQINSSCSEIAKKVLQEQEDSYSIIRQTNAEALRYKFFNLGYQFRMNSHPVVF